MRPYCTSVQRLTSSWVFNDGVNIESGMKYEMYMRVEPGYGLTFEIKLLKAEQEYQPF